MVKMVFDFHSHTFFSDGELIPSELVRQAFAVGYGGIAITDHGDHSNIDFVIPRLVKACQKLSAAYEIKVLPGIELTHVPPQQIAELVGEARLLGAKIVLVHGETITEPVCSGTNRAAIEARVDILAHPGLIKVAEVELAARNGVFLEISARRGSCLTNGHVATLARKYGAPLLVNSDAHAPTDLLSEERYYQVARGAGLTDLEVTAVLNNALALAQKASQ